MNHKGRETFQVVCAWVEDLVRSAVLGRGDRWVLGGGDV